jgi:hypothetical protein
VSDGFSCVVCGEDARRDGAYGWADICKCGKKHVTCKGCWDLGWKLKLVGPIFRSHGMEGFWAGWKQCPSREIFIARKIMGVDLEEKK